MTKTLHGLSPSDFMLCFSAPLATTGSLPARSFNVSSRMATDLASDHSYRFSDTDHYLLPQSHAWDLLDMVKAS